MFSLASSKQRLASSSEQEIFLADTSPEGEVL